MPRSASRLVWLAAGVLALMVVGLVQAAPSLVASPASLSSGGKAYDAWWKVVPGATEPKDDHPLWSLQTTNTRKGPDTWRCKECHGWDYKGKDGAYGKGSHFTGFKGVLEAGQSKTVDELTAILKGSTNPKHDFSNLLDAATITNLANFLKEGLLDETKLIDSATKKPVSADVNHGKQLYDGTCAACHGADGTKLNFGSEQEPEYVGTLAADNPWEFLHKVRAGQPGAVMPSGFENGWTTQDAVDALAHAQTLPAKIAAPTPTPPAAPTLPKTGEDLSWTWMALATLAGLLLIISGTILRRRT